ncbi:DUF4405 domain-containing protein [Siculibacillus lacustris]|uniref:DUF4405 domain-containing protein n=1 Tax=Siculibacillus lacustris TaxID=1549641 RepID=A0A4Q9VEC3_9HYPH|nr:DUF4405 domain-containing protein [Siculibacillus lacustris]TBW33013.1 DUF4405 domain-containing protein [Siculibacillus lacustris]
MFTTFINRYSTPFTTGLFLVSLISGIALFFHVGQSYFHGMHEWLSMVLILPFGFHVWKNWGPILNYLQRGWLLVPLAVSLAAAVVFMVPAALGTGAGGGNPMVVMATVLADAKIVDLAPILKTTPEVLVTRLKAAGIPVASTETSVATAAAAAGKDGREVAFHLVAGR